MKQTPPNHSKENGKGAADPAVYKQEMERIFNMLTGNSSNNYWCQTLSNMYSGNINVWRTSWAFDTIVDYLKIMQDENPDYQPQSCSGSGSFIDDVINKALAPDRGFLWDDYGWLGIVSLRALTMLKLTEAQKQTFFQYGINAWCLMYGMGWENGTGPTDCFKDFKFPFLNDDGSIWQKALEHLDTVTDPYLGNVGAPKVFYWAYKHDIEMDKFRPRYEGGVWNAVINTLITPVQLNNYNPDKVANPYYEPIQNTVTNGLFTLLTLRTYQALTNPANAPYLKDANINTDAVLAAWNDIMDYWVNWFSDENNPDDSRLIMQLHPEAVLIRERVPRFKNGKWDQCFNKQVAWTGDQGLLMAAMYEAHEYLRAHPSNAPAHRARLEASRNFLRILIGVRETCFANMGNEVPAYGHQLRPWVQVNGSVREYDDFPIGDNEDYQTGSGVFFRYLNQLFDAEPALAARYRTVVEDTADRLCNPDFPAPSQNVDYKCDAIIRQYEANGNYSTPMTPYINRMALLCMAYNMNKANKK